MPLFDELLGRPVDGSGEASVSRLGAECSISLLLLARRCLSLWATPTLLKLLFRVSLSPSSGKGPKGSAQPQQAEAGCKREDTGLMVVKKGPFCL
jgi:hypothetical protein